jgi:transcriptional regulator with XRE-family HTH domain
MLSIVSVDKFSERLKTLRENHNMSQRKLSEVLGMGSTVVYFYESGKKLPSIEVLLKLSQYFNVSADYLLGLTDDPFGGIPESFKEKIKKCDFLENENKELKRKIKTVVETLSKNDGGIGE